MCHRAGLVREPPIGNYFDPDEPSLERTVKSLNGTELVYAPESHLKYSNAGVAVVGLVLEQTQNQAYPRYVYRTILDPLGMKHSSLEADPAVTKDLAKAVMWSYDGREFPAPTFTLGENPAGGLYTTVNDLSRFLAMLFAGGKAGDNVIVEAGNAGTDVEAAVRQARRRAVFGLGFVVGSLDGHRRVGHGGAVYGFATEMDALPDDKLGVVVVDLARLRQRRHVAHCRCRIAANAGGQAEQAGAEDRRDGAVKPEDARKLAGKYKSGDKTLELTERDGRLYALPGARRLPRRAAGAGRRPDRGRPPGLRPEVRARRRQAQGQRRRVRKGRRRKSRRRRRRSSPGLIGEYGWDHNTLFILEKDGKLWALDRVVLPLPAGGGEAGRVQVPGVRPLFGRENCLHARQGRPGDAGGGGRACRSSAGRSTARTARRSGSSRCGRWTSCARKRVGEAAGGEGRFPQVGPGGAGDAGRFDQARHPLRHRQQLPRHAALHLRQGVHAEAGGGGAGARQQEAGGAGLRPAGFRRLPAVVGDEDVLGGDAGEAADLRGRPVAGIAPQPRLRGGPDAVRPQDGQAGGDDRRLSTRSRTAPTPTTPAARRCSAGTGNCCGARWRRRASRSTKRSGGISTTRTGKSTRSAR